MARPTPEYELTEAADGDLLAIARYTIKKWGVQHARRYETALEK
jgi:plasmid stabilization system protein ParE